MEKVHRYLKQFKSISAPLYRTEAFATESEFTGNVAVAHTVELKGEINVRGYSSVIFTVVSNTSS